MRKRRRRRPRQPQSPNPLGLLRRPQSPLRRSHPQGHPQPAPHSLRQSQLLRRDRLFRQPPRQLRLPLGLPRLPLPHPRRGQRLQLAHPLQIRLRHNHLRPARRVRQRLLQLPRLALRARLDRQVPRRRDNRDASPPRVLVRASAKVGRALPRECALRPHRVSPGPAAHRGLLARRRQDFRNGRAPDVLVRRPLEASVPARRAFRVCPRRSQESPYISESRPLHADVRPSKNAMPKVSAGCTQFERAPALERDARHTLNLWPLCNANRGTSRLRKALPFASSPKKWIFARRTC